jgi:FlaA1/EpsC-like NDP-sugar epimerase
MRRRLRSAAFPIHRHAVPQVALDAGLVALAYYLAYRLRFDGGIPPAYMDLFERTIAWAIFGSILCFALVGMYRHWMRYSSQREYFKIAEGTVLAVLSLVGYVTIVQPRLISSPSGFVSLGVPAGVLVLFGLLVGAFLTATRYAVHFFYVRSVSGFRSRRI